MQPTLYKALVALVFLAAGALAVNSPTFLEVGGNSIVQVSSHHQENYDDFLSRFGHRDNKSAAYDQVTFAERSRLFQLRRAAVNEHNARPRTWTAAVNRFADYTDAELASLLGYRRAPAHRLRQASVSSKVASSLLSFTRNASSPERASGLHELDVDHRAKLPVSKNFVRNQENCGSCWAVAAIGVLEMHMELMGATPKPLSFVQVVDCAPNPHHCGGFGGCDGATAGLAYEYIQRHGVASEVDYTRLVESEGRGFSCKPVSAKSASIGGHVHLPVNKLEPLLQTLASQGPAVVSVDASTWFPYAGGIFDGCSADAVVDHSIIAIGYGSDPTMDKKYFLLRNSWGPWWGESGYIRLLRHSTDTGVAGHCGTDRSPGKGVFCDGGPAEVPVCGMCGILSDTVYPQALASHQAGSASGRFAGNQWMSEGSGILGRFGVL